MNKVFTVNPYGNKVYEFSKVWKKELCTEIAQYSLERAEEENLRLVAYAICLVAYASIAFASLNVILTAFCSLSQNVQLITTIVAPCALAFVAAPAVVICQNIIACFRSIKFHLDQREQALQRRVVMQGFFSPDEAAAMF